MRPISSRSILVLTLVAFVLFIFVMGCSKKPVSVSQEVSTPLVSQEENQPAKSLEEGESIIATALNNAPSEEKSFIGFHIVKKGECLWWIAEYEDIYNDPFMWPIIFAANKDQIKNPDLIYPGQKFIIPRAGYTLERIKEVRKSAGAPHPYLPPENTTLPAVKY